MPFELGVGYPLLAAFLLGFIGAIEPCQLSNNTAAFMMIGNKQSTLKTFPRREFFFFIFGKAVTYWMIGFFVLTFGHSMANTFSPVFDWINKLLGPLFIVAGLFLLRLFHFSVKLPVLFSGVLTHLSSRKDNGEKTFVIGVVMALGFCPTMFWLFFGLLVPVMFSNSIGIILPIVFAIGTALPLFILLRIFVRLGENASVLRHSKQWGTIIKRVVGVIFILLGIREFVAYWL